MPGRGEKGFALVEVMVALCLFALLAVALAGLFLNGQVMTALAQKRSGALELAQGVLEGVRQAPPEWEGKIRGWSGNYAVLESKTQNIFPGLYLALVRGTGEGQVREITDYNPSTCKATVSPAWDTPPDSSTTYLVFALNPPTGSRTGEELKRILVTAPASSSELETVNVKVSSPPPVQEVTLMTERFVK